MEKFSEPFQAVILAGGHGTRLYPFTASVPKPLLPIGEHPVIELIIRRLVHFGATRITIAVSYLAHLIESCLGQGERFGVPIDYARENIPLGTAGPIGLIASWAGPLIVTNGDVLSDIDFERLLRCHREQGASLTVATMMQSLKIEVGVLTTDSSLRVTGIVEKPSIQHRINLGAYVIDEHVQGLVAPNQRLEMPELIGKLIARGEAVTAYDHCGLWLDIGRPDDLAKAQAEARFWSRMAEEKSSERRFSEKTSDNNQTGSSSI